jgi:hypothetical protein
MPGGGSKPGERRGGRQRGTPNKTLTRSTRALLILFGTPCLRAFTDVCGFAMASLCTLQSRPEFIGFVDRDFDRLIKQNRDFLTWTYNARIRYLLGGWSENTRRSKRILALHL